MPRLSRTHILVALIGLSCTASFFIFSPPQPSCSSSPCQVSGRQADVPHHRLAVIVPFRSRFDELLQFVPHVTEFLQKQRLNFTIHVMNQVDELRFNRAALINAGFSIVGRESDYIAMHDVDLLPINEALSYRFPGCGTVFHISSPELHPKYHYATFVGGILLVTSRDFELLDGMSNKYWGWGMEDDEFYVRMKEKKLRIVRPAGITTGTNGTFVHNHKRSHRRDTAKLFNQREVTRRRDRETGLHSVSFKLVAQHKVTVNGSWCTVHDIELICDHNLTPWCEPKSRSSPNSTLPTSSSPF